MHSAGWGQGALIQTSNSIRSRENSPLKVYTPPSEHTNLLGANKFTSYLATYITKQTGFVLPLQFHISTRENHPDIGLRVAEISYADLVQAIAAE
jgi:hypothetical protein